MAAAWAAGAYDYALFGGGLLGFEVGAGLAARLGAGVAMEITAVHVTDGKLVAERPILGDSADRARSASRSEPGHHHRPPQRVRHQASPAPAPAAVENLDVELSEFSTQAQMITRGEQRGDEVDIEGADVLIAGGRGLGAAEGFQLCEDLAGAFGGTSAVAATRAVVDAGWFPYAGQIGQTGKTVAPKLYLAAGISGAIQHKVGMQNSEHIVAINKDANAPIFEFSDLGIVGDLHKIMPEAHRGREGQEGRLITMAGANGNGRAVPAAYPPPVASPDEFIKRGLDPEDERIEVGVADRRRRDRRAGLREPHPPAARR